MMLSKLAESVIHSTFGRDASNHGNLTGDADGDVKWCGTWNLFPQFFDDAK